MSADRTQRTARAPAKVNLSLRVGPPRPDGYHELATVFHAVHLDDLVTATAAEDNRVTVEVSDEFGAVVPGVPADASNLAVRAALLLRDQLAPAARGVHLSVRKSIPVAGGMAGGSADAAATLVACAALWQTGLERADLVPLAARLGSDVPFALCGGTALGTGRGERLAPVATTGRLHWVLAQAETGLSTPAVYTVLDGLRAHRQVPDPGIDPRLLEVLERGLVGALGLLVDNDLEPAVVELRPGLLRTLAAGRSAGARAGLVCGSGPSLVFLVDPRSAAPVARALAVQPDVAGVRHLTGPAPGAELVG